MGKLKTILQTAVERGDKLGNDNLIQRLDTYRQRQFKVFVMVEFGVMLAVAACAWYLVTHPAQTTTMKAVAGLIGLGSGGGLEIARRTWKEWARTDLLLLMISEAPQPQVKAMVDRLLKAL